MLISALFAGARDISFKGSLIHGLDFANDLPQMIQIRLIPQENTGHDDI